MRLQGILKMIASLNPKKNKIPKIAILGFSLESNKQAPVSDRNAFIENAYLDAEDIKKS